MLRFVEGFDWSPTMAHYVLGKWTGFGANTPAIDSANRFGTGMTLRITDPRQGIYKQLDSYENWMIVGAAFNFSDFGSGGDAFVKLFMQDGGVHCCLRINDSGVLYGQLGTSGAELAIASTPLPAENVWCYIETKVRIEDSPNGRFVVNVNGVTVIDFTGDVRNGASNVVNQLQLFGLDPGFANCACWIDDLYICDADGSVNNDFLGDSRVETLWPNGNGNSSQFDGSDGNTVDNYLLVDDTTPDDDTTYVESADVGDKDTYAHGNLVTTSGGVHGLQLMSRGKKSTAGSKTFVSVARHSGTEEDSTAFPLFDSYAHRADVRETKPGGGGWSISDVNAAEFGYKVNS